MTADTTPFTPAPPPRPAWPATPPAAARAPAAYPRSWYLVCRSSELRPGGVVSRDFLGRPIVLFRTPDGAAHALSAHCAHMGAHLGRGTVVGDCLRCPLHHWEFDRSGACRNRPATDSPVGSNGAVVAATDPGGQLPYPVAERYGGVFVFNGPRPLYPAPSFDGIAEADLRNGVGPAVIMRCPWIAPVANGFDMQHLQTVHGRALREPPEVDRPDPFRFRLRYLSRVTGRGPADRVMRWLSGDRISVRLTCWGGTVMMVESRAGRSGSLLLVGMMPTGDGVAVTPVFCVPRARVPGPDLLRLGLSRWLFTAFLRKDVGIMEDMDFRPALATMAADDPLRMFLEFVAGLPHGPAAWARLDPASA